MSTSERIFLIASFPSLVEGLFFAQVHNADRTRVVYETGLYTTKEWAISAAREWAHKSQSKLAKSLEKNGRM